MVTSTLAIARNAFVECLRQPMFLGVILVSGVLQLFNTWGTAFAMGFSMTPGEVTGDNKLLFDIGLATVFVMGILQAAFMSSAVISREIENKTVLTVISKPVGRFGVILGKYLGVAGAMVVTIVIMVVYLQLGLRHGIQSTAADKVDTVVVTFGLGGSVLAVVLGAIGNYLFGWSFSQTSCIALLGTSVLGIVATFGISKEWHFQPLSTDFMPQVTLACLGLGMALLVFTAVATAASTRFGQVMTILICAGVFLGGLLSNHVIGRHAYDNTTMGVIKEARPPDGIILRQIMGTPVLELAAERAGVSTEEFLARPELRTKDFVSKWEVLDLVDRTDPTLRRALLLEIGSTYEIELVAPPRDLDAVPGATFYYGPSPNGVGLVPPRFDPPAEDLDINRDVFPQDTPPALVITSVDGPTLTVRHIGGRPMDLDRPPVEGDFAFVRPTTVHPLAASAWAIVPNMQSFWLVDAVSQNKPIPASHMLMLVGYMLTQISMMLAVATLLFQGRDVG